MLKRVAISCPQTHRELLSQDSPFILLSNDASFTQIDELANRILFHISFFFNKFAYDNPGALRVYPLSISGGDINYIVIKKPPIGNSSSSSSASPFPFFTTGIQTILTTHNDPLSAKELIQCTHAKVDFIRADILDVKKDTNTTNFILQTLSRRNPADLSQTAPLESLQMSLSAQLKIQPRFFDFLIARKLDLETPLVDLVKHLSVSFSRLLIEKANDHEIKKAFFQERLTTPIVHCLRSEAKEVMVQVLSKVKVRHNGKPIQHHLEEFMKLLAACEGNGTIEIKTTKSLEILFLVLSLEIAIQTITHPTFYQITTDKKALEFPVKAVLFPSQYLVGFSQAPSSHQTDRNLSSEDLFEMISDKKTELLSLNLPPALEALYLMYFDSIALARQIASLTKWEVGLTDDPVQKTKPYYLSLQHILAQLASSLNKTNCLVEVSSSIWQPSPFYAHILEVKDSTVEFLKRSLLTIPPDLRGSFQPWLKHSTADLPKIDSKLLATVFDLQMSKWHIYYQSLLDGALTYENEEDTKIYSSKRRRCTEDLHEIVKLYPPQYFNYYNITVDPTCKLTSIELQKLLTTYVKILALTRLYESYKENNRLKSCDLGIVNLLHDQIATFNQLSHRASIKELGSIISFAGPKNICISVSSAFGVITLSNLVIPNEQIISEMLFTNFEELSLYHLFEDLSRICSLSRRERKIALQTNDLYLVSQYTKQFHSPSNKTVLSMEKYARFASRVFEYIDHLLDSLPLRVKTTLEKILKSPTTSTKHLDWVKEIINHPPSSLSIGPETTFQDVLASQTTSEEHINWVWEIVGTLPEPQQTTLQELLENPATISKHLEWIKEIWDESFDIKLSIAANQSSAATQSLTSSSSSSSSSS